MADTAACSTHSKEFEKFTLFAASNSVFVWDPETVFQLRTKHRIVGSLVGSLPRKPRQNVYLSLPLILSKEETTLLLDKKFARLVQSENEPLFPPREEVEKFINLRQESLTEQVKMFIEEREEKEFDLAEVIAEGRKRKKERRKNQLSLAMGNTTESATKKTKLESDVEEDSIRVDEPDEWKEVEASGGHLCTFGEQKELCISESNVDLESDFLTGFSSTKDKMQNDSTRIQESNQREFCTTSEANVHEMVQKDSTEKRLIRNDEKIQIDNFHDGNRMEKLNEDEIDRRLQGALIHIPTRASHAAVQRFPEAPWAYPQTAVEKLRYRIFKDLWEKDLFITCGFKFGGDFLAYPGDPAKFHSYYIVIAVPWEREADMLDVISIGRLGATVKKTAVFASVDPNGQVVYMSVKWSGIS